MRVAGLRDGNEWIGFALFVLGSALLAWAFLHFASEDFGRLFVVGALFQSPRWAPVCVMTACAAIVWLATARLRPNWFRGVSAGLLCLAIGYNVALTSSLLLTVPMADWTMGFLWATVFSFTVLVIPQTWLSLVLLPIVGIFASAWARQVDAPEQPTI